MTEILKNSAVAIQTVVNKLKDGGIVCFPTETLYALACDPDNAQAVAKIYSLKQRSKSQPLSLLVKDLAGIKQIAKTNTDIESFINSNCPGPVTIILNKKSTSGAIGVRIPDHNIAQQILELFGKPIIGTSTNLSGEKPATKISEINPELLANIDIILDGGPTKFGIGSTIIDLTDSARARILREGVFKTSQ